MLHIYNPIDLNQDRLGKQNDKLKNQTWHQARSDSRLQTGCMEVKLCSGFQGYN